MAKNTALTAFKAGLKAKSRGGRRKSKITIPLAVVGGFVPMGAKLLSDWNQYHDINIITRELGQFTTGFDWTTGKFSLGGLRYGLLPIVAGFGVHYMASKFGINKAIARAGIPFLRI